MKTRLRLIRDTREQRVLTEFQDGVFDEIIDECRPTGDYWGEVSFDGGEWKEIPIVGERKNIGDLFGTLTTGHARFKKEIERANEFGLTIIILIEGTMREIAAGYKYSTVKGDTILKKLATLHVKYGIEYHFFPDRRSMSRFIEETFQAVARNWGKENK